MTDRAKVSCYTLVGKIRKRKNGLIRLGPNGDTIEVRNCPARLKRAILENRYAVLCWLREERACAYAAAHGKDWWKTYPHGTTLWCDPPVNCDLEHENVFDVMKRIVADNVKRRGRVQ